MRQTRIVIAIAVVGLLAGCSESGVGEEVTESEPAGTAEGEASQPEASEEAESEGETAETEEPAADEEASGTSTFVFADLDANTQSQVDELCFGAVVEEGYDFDYKTLENQLYSGQLNVPALTDAVVSADPNDEASFIAAVAPVCEASDWSP